MKYMGSKNKIKKYILPIILDGMRGYEYYIEPFCGSLAVIELKKVACDANPFLIGMWMKLKSDRNYLSYCVERGDIICDGGKYFIERDKYLYYRELYRDRRGNDSKILLGEYFDETALMGFIGYMGSFNGKFYDGGYSGKTSTRNYIDEQIRNTLSQVDTLHDIIFQCEDYVNLFKRISTYNKPVIIYCDPPYRGTTDYAYSKNFDHDKFYELCSWMSDLGHRVIISEYEMPSPQFKCIWEMEVTNSLSKTKTYKPVERLFVPNAI